MAGLLGEIFGTADVAKRRLRDFMANPALGAQQALGNLNDKARNINEMTSAAAMEGVDYGPASQRLGGLLADAYGPVGMITPASRPALSAMTKEQFLGKPKIVGMADAKDLKPKVWQGVMDAPSQPFLGGKYEVRMLPDAAVVFDKGRPIASYNSNSTLVVDPKYRKQGIGEELVYQQRTTFPAPAQAETRNKVSQRIQENVWDRIQRELYAMRPSLLD